MSTISLHPIEYLKAHKHLEGVRLITVATSLVKKILDLAEPAAKVAALVLTGALIVLALSTIVESGEMIASFCDAIPKVVLTP